MGSPIIIGLRADSKSRGFFGERMRTEVSRETSRLTGMRAVPRAGQGHYGGQGSGLGTRAPVREEVGEAAPVGGRQSEGGAPAAAFGPNGLAPASPAEGREAGRQRTHAMHDYRGLPTEERRETPGRKKWRGRRIVHSAHSLPCAGKRSVAGRSPARVPSCAPSPTRTDVSRETFRMTGMRAAPRAGRRRRTERRGRPGQRARTQIPRNRAQNANPEELDADADPE